MKKEKKSKRILVIGTGGTIAGKGDNFKTSDYTAAQIKIDDLVLGESKLKINPYLKEWTEEVNAHTTTTLDHSHSVLSITHPTKLKKGKQVFCYGFEYNEESKSYQRYVVLEVIE